VFIEYVLGEKSATNKDAVVISYLVECFFPDICLDLGVLVML